MTATYQTQSSSTDSVQIDFNEKQFKAKQSNARIKTLVMSRRAGKNFFGGDWSIDCVEAMPKSNADFVTGNIKQLKNNSVPSMELVWKEYGYKEIRKPGDIGHYIKWKTPPHWFAQSHQEPNDYTNVISFYNGVRIQLLGLTNKNSGRGGTSDWMLIDEAGFINVKVLRTAVLPRLSGPWANYPDNPKHRSILIITSAPDTTAGMWVYDYKLLAAAEPDKYYYDEATVWDNSKVLGIDFIKDLKKTMPKHIWQREYENIVDAKPVSAYYPGFGESHLYECDEWGRDPYYNPNIAMSISFDFNTEFECCLVAQERPSAMFVQKEMWDFKIDDTVQQFCDYYADHKEKIVFIYGDAIGHHNKPGGNLEKTYDNIRKLFRANGWTPIQKTKSKNQPPHKDRYDLIDDCFSEKKEGYPAIRINQNDCPSLIRAMKLTPIFSDYKKDKSSEKSRQNRQYATHLPDCFDYLVWYVFKRLVKSTSIKKLIG